MGRDTQLYQRNIRAKREERQVNRPGGAEDSRAGIEVIFSR